MCQHAPWTKATPLYQEAQTRARIVSAVGCKRGRAGKGPPLAQRACGHSRAQNRLSLRPGSIHVCDSAQACLGTLRRGVACASLTQPLACTPFINSVQVQVTQQRRWNGGKNSHAYSMCPAPSIRRSFLVIRKVQGATHREHGFAVAARNASWYAYQSCESRSSLVGPSIAMMCGTCRAPGTALQTHSLQPLSLSSTPLHST